jgi:hypothetical protein
MTTFEDLSAVFPLFDASIAVAVEYCGHGKCSICGRRVPACFPLDIGCVFDRIQLNASYLGGPYWSDYCSFDLQRSKRQASEEGSGAAIQAD